MSEAPLPRAAVHALRYTYAVTMFHLIACHRNKCVTLLHAVL